MPDATILGLGSSNERKTALVTSIIIPVFNRIELTRLCLSSVLDHTDRRFYELVIVDNGSSDGTGSYCAELKARYPHVKVVQNAENLGFSKACNQGAEAATGDYLLFLNNDTEVMPGWFHPLTTTLDRDPAVAAVGNKLLYPDGAVQHCGVAVVQSSEREWLVAIHLFRGANANIAEVNERRIYQVVTGACMLVRRSSFRAVGGFDEGYWNGYEDVDLCFKLREAGGEIVYEPASVVIHKESQSGPERLRKASENDQRLNDKWLGKVAPDYIVDPGGSYSTTANLAIRPYETPIDYSLAGRNDPCPCGSMIKFKKCHGAQG